MAEELVVMGAGEIIKKVCSFAAQEIGAVWGVKTQLKNLQNSFSMIQAVLIDAERRQVEEESVKLWLKRLKQVAYDADDVLDEFKTELLLCKSKVNNLFSLPFRLKIAHKIMEINQILVGIEKDKDIFKFNEIITAHVRVIAQKTSSHFNVSQIVGRENEKNKLVDLLIKLADHDYGVSVISIVGMGGLGKTTLAQIVYNHKLVEDFFDLRIWVCVSQVFDVETILRQIIESVTRSECGLTNIDVIANTLQENLSQKRFLIVLDDVWNEEADKWERFRILIGECVRGSKIIVTTRIANVASVVGSFAIHNLEKLAKEECWLLFKSRAFGAGGAEETSNFVEIGKDLASKCGGVPLALMHLGSLMHTKKDERQWLQIRDSEIWGLPENKKIIGLLKMSYNNLSPPLKQCFSYCAMFPKDKVINTKMLVQLWMAEGFLEPPENSTCLMEDIGEEYLDILIQNSFFQDVQKDGFGCIREFKMHDLVHDLARSVVGHEYCFEKLSRVEDVSEIRHLSSTSDLLASFPDTNKLRTFILQERISKDPFVVFNNKFLKLKFIRVLDLHGFNIREVPCSIRKLRHLRYLDLSKTQIVRLPDSICSLCNLLTLRLASCEELKELPEEMKKLVSLRHLEFMGSKKLSKIPGDLQRLSSLQTLSRFIVGEEGSGCSLRELQFLNLGGDLLISRLENVENATEAEAANLKNKSNIQTLGLYWSDSNDEVHGRSQIDNVLECLQPHSNLKKLEIFKFLGVKIPTWLNVTFLPNLVEMYIGKWRRCKHLPPLGQLPCLRFLEIADMEALTCMGDDWYGHDKRGGNQDGGVIFPSLQKLFLTRLCNLEEWTEPDCYSCCLFPLLETLRIEWCPKLTQKRRLLPSLVPSLKKLRVIGGNITLLQSLSAKASSLTTLDMRQINDMTSLPQDLLQRNCLLHELTIGKCPELKALPFEELKHLKSLQSLQLFGCKNLSCVPDLGCLSSLRTLFMADLKGMKSFPEWLNCLPFLEDLLIGEFGEELDCLPLEGIQRTPSLRNLGLVGQTNIKSLPEQLGLLTKLQVLSLFNFESLVALPDCLIRLSSLQQLFITDCIKIQNLPNIPARYLMVRNCPILKDKYERGELSMLTRVQGIIFS